MTEQVAIEQTYTRGAHPNSVSNLRPWPPGQSGCPGGQRASGAYVAEWRNAMLGENDDGTARYTRADLEAVVADDAAPPAKIIAARWILNCMKSSEVWVAGKDGEPLPARMDTEPGRERERLMDRTEGKPTITIRREEPIRPPADILDEIVAMHEQHPELIDRSWPITLRECNKHPELRARLLPIIEKHNPDLARALEPVETTAKVLPAD